MLYQTKNTPRLILTADDYGMSPLFNKGILALAKQQKITGISVMIKRKYIRAQELLETGVPIGLHLELSEKDSMKEISSQIKSFKKRFAQLPAYLDGHQHRHLTPRNLILVIHAAKKFHLPVRSRFSQDRKIMRVKKISTPNDFISWHPNYISVLQKKLRATKGAIVEMVCHPGYFDKRCHYPYNRQRFAELTFLKSLAFSKTIRRFELISYRELSH